MTAIPPPATIAEGREWLAAHMYDDIVACPCCTQDVRVYRRKLNERIARVMIEMHHQARREWVHLPSLGRDRGVDVPPSASGEVAFAERWGLIERMTGKGSRGFWRVTLQGAMFLGGQVTVPKYLWLYDGEVVDPPTGCEGDNEQVSIADVLGTAFDLGDLMANR